MKQEALVKALETNLMNLKGGVNRKIGTHLEKVLDKSPVKNYFVVDRGC
jgi:hypothetical protein